jgi:hypothetical protein
MADLPGSHAANLVLIDQLQGLANYDLKTYSCGR